MAKSFGDKSMNKQRMEFLFLFASLFFLFIVTEAQVTNRAVLDTTGDGRTDLHLVTHADPGGGLRVYWCSRAITNQSSQIGCTNLRFFAQPLETAQ